MYIDFRNTPTNFSEFGGLKMIACAVITGIYRHVTREAGWRGQTEPYSGSHYHAANDMMEYIVFNEVEIIPCHVIHPDLGRDAAKFITTLSMNTSAYINQYREEQRKEKYAYQNLGLVVLGPGRRNGRSKLCWPRRRSISCTSLAQQAGQILLWRILGRYLKMRNCMGSIKRIESIMQGRLTYGPLMDIQTLL